MKKKLFAILTSLVVMCAMLTVSSYAETEEPVTTTEESIVEEPASTYDSGVSVDIPVTVTWNDTAAETTPDKPDSVNVSLKGNDGSEYTTTISPDADNNWTGNFKDVDPYNEDGSLKEFTVDGDDLKVDYGYEKTPQTVENKGVNLTATEAEKYADCSPDRGHEIDGAEIAIAKKTNSIKDGADYYIWTKFDTSKNEELQDSVIKAIKDAKLNGLGDNGTPITKDNTVFRWGTGENAEYSITDNKGQTGTITVENDKISFSEAKVWSLVFTLNAVFSTDTEAALPYEYVPATDPTDPVDPTDPTDPVDPTEPTDPTDPVDPTDPTDPTDPVDPTEPTDPTVPVDPTEPSEPETTVPTVTEPTGPENTVVPTEPAAETNAPQATAAPSAISDNAPKTGDSNMPFYFGILALAAAAVFTTVALTGRRKES